MAMINPKEFEEEIKPESPKDEKKDKREIVTNRNDLNRVLLRPKNGSRFEKWVEIQIQWYLVKIWST